MTTESIKQAARRLLPLTAACLRGNRTVTTVDLSRVRSFLFLQYEQALGSNIHATPIFEALKQRVPDCWIGVACAGMALEVMRKNPFIDRVLPTPHAYNETIGAMRSLKAHLNANRLYPQCIVTTSGNTRTTVLLTGLVLGRTLRVGWTSVPELYDAHLTYEPAISLIANNLRLLELLGHRSTHCEPRVSFDLQDLAEAKRLLADGGLDQTRPTVICVTQTNPAQRKSWLKDRFVGVANYAAQELGYQTIFVGTSGEAGRIEEIRDRLRLPSVSFAGKTSLPVLSAMMCLADCAVTLDTGTMHIGRSAGLPMVILAPAWSPVIEWLPLGSDDYRILKGPDIPLPTPEDYMLEEISVESVTKELAYLHQYYPPSEQARSARVGRSLVSGGT